MADPPTDMSVMRKSAEKGRRPRELRESSGKKFLKEKGKGKSDSEKCMEMDKIGWLKGIDYVRRRGCVQVRRVLTN